MFNLFIFLIIAVGLAGFFKVCRVRDIIPQILQVIIAAALIQPGHNTPFIIIVFIIFPWWFMFLGYREIYREIRRFINFIKEQKNNAHAMQTDSERSANA